VSARIVLEVMRGCVWRWSLGLPRSVWGVQVFSWLVIIIATKIVIALVMYAIWSPLDVLGSLMAKTFRHHRKLELVLVMIVAPTFLNAVQFWVRPRSPQPCYSREVVHSGVAWVADSGQLPESIDDGLGHGEATTHQGCECSTPAAALDDGRP
jgi:hypothetical protein